MALPKGHRYSVRRGDYDKHHARRKIFLRGWPDGLPRGIVTATHGASGTTTTVLFHLINNESRFPINFNSTGWIVPRLSGNLDTHTMSWQVPDDFYPGGDTHVWLIWAHDAPTTTTVAVSYDVTYSATKVVDYHRKTSAHASLTGEALTAASTAMSTDLDETVKLDGLTQFAPYRSMRGTINGGLLDIGDLVQFLVKLDAAPISGGRIGVVGLEIDYEQRLRDSSIEVYSES